MKSLENITSQEALANYFGNLARPNARTAQKTLSNSKNTENDLKRINRVFLRLSAIYGHIWSSQFRQIEYLNFTKEEWILALREFTDDSIEKAINECSKSHEMPPTLPQFYQLCRRYNPPIKKISNAPEKTGDPEIAKIYIDKIRQILSKSNEVIR